MFLLLFTAFLLLPAAFLLLFTAFFAVLLSTPSRGREQQLAKIPFQIAYAMGFSPSNSGFCAENRAKIRRIRGSLNSNFAVSHVFQLLFAGYVRSFRRLRTVIAPAIHNPRADFPPAMRGLSAACARSLLRRRQKKGSHHARPDGGIWQLTLSFILMFNYYC